MSGHRLPRVTSTPLSMLTSSVGSPQMLHSRTSTGLASVPRRLTSPLTGMPALPHAATQPATSCWRYAPVKAP
eukprot:6143-Chlamydomonas_euryale.AAC.1